MAQENNISSGPNLLVQAANRLLNVFPKIRQLPSHADPAQLRKELIEEMRRFEICGQQANLPHAVIIGARYCLCTVLDEAASLTPWGSSNVWSGSGLLVTFHNETWGGEKFFQLLATLSRSPNEHIDLLELINFCLLLGFEGRYRVIDNGRSQLEAVKQRLLQLIRVVRGNYTQQLSPQAACLLLPQTIWRPSITLRACAVLAVLSATLLFIVLNWQLGNDTDQVVATIDQARLPQVSISPPAQIMPEKPSLKGLLRDDIAQGLVAVRDEAQQSVVTLKGDGLFSSAAAKVRPDYIAVIDRVATALNSVSGDILVVGYTDNMPIHSLRFASNRELSLARAQAISAQLRQHLDDPKRVKAEGRGESNPIAPNNSKMNRALNRRVEIVLLAAPEKSQMNLGNLPQGNGK